MFLILYSSDLVSGFDANCNVCIMVQGVCNVCMCVCVCMCVSDALLPSTISQEHGLMSFLVCRWIYFVQELYCFVGGQTSCLRSAGVKK